MNQCLWMRQQRNTKKEAEVWLIFYANCVAEALNLRKPDECNNATKASKSASVASSSVNIFHTLLGIWRRCFRFLLASSSSSNNRAAKTAFFFSRIRHAKVYSAEQSMVKDSHRNRVFPSWDWGQTSPRQSRSLLNRMLKGWIDRSKGHTRECRVLFIAVQRRGRTASRKAFNHNKSMVMHSFLWIWHGSGSEVTSRKPFAKTTIATWK